MGYDKTFLLLVLLLASGCSSYDDDGMESASYSLKNAGDYPVRAIFSISQCSGSETTEVGPHSETRTKESFDCGDFHGEAHLETQIVREVIKHHFDLDLTIYVPDASQDEAFEVVMLPTPDAAALEFVQTVPGTSPISLTVAASPATYFVGVPSDRLAPGLPPPALSRVEGDVSYLALFQTLEHEILSFKFDAKSLSQDIEVTCTSETCDETEVSP